MCGSSFDGVHDLCQRKDFRRLLVDQRHEDHMDMIRHYDRDTQVKLVPVVMEAALQNGLANTLGQGPAFVHAES